MHVPLCFFSSPTDRLGMAKSDFSHLLFRSLTSFVMTASCSLALSQKYLFKTGQRVAVISCCQQFRQRFQVLKCISFSKTHKRGATNFGLNSMKVLLSLKLWKVKLNTSVLPDWYNSSLWFKTKKKLIKSNKVIFSSSETSKLRLPHYAGLQEMLVSKTACSFSSLRNWLKTVVMVCERNYTTV